VRFINARTDEAILAFGKSYWTGLGRNAQAAALSQSRLSRGHSQPDEKITRRRIPQKPNNACECDDKQDACVGIAWVWQISAHAKIPKNF
jgi:hypothetical protein